VTVYQHKNSPYWQYDFQVRGQRYTGSTGCTSKSAAKEFERKERNRVAEGVTVKPDLTVDEAFGNYWMLVGQHESNSVTTRGQLARMKTFFGATTLIRELDRAEIDRYVARRRGQTANHSDRLVSNATVNRETQLLKRVLRRVPDKYAKPVIDWTGVMLKEAQERVRELSQAEERALFEQLDEDLGAVAEFAMLSGQRRESVITLLWSKVDLHAGRAEVRVKGDRWHSFPLTPRMVAIIANRPKVGPRVFTYVCARPAPKRGDRPARIKGERYPFSSEGWKRKWAKALKDAGITDFRFHDLRHTAATRVTRATGNLKIAQKLLGHTAIATTARYAHAAEDDVRNGLLATESRNSPGGVVSNETKRMNRGGK
jgi:integrase